jgi:hypothetical protein
MFSDTFLRPRFSLITSLYLSGLLSSAILGSHNTSDELLTVSINTYDQTQQGKQLIMCINRRINVRDYWRDNQKWTIQRNWQHRVHKTSTKQKQHNMCWTHYTQANTINVNTTWAILQKMNRTSFLCGNRNGHHNTELRT